MNEHNLKPTIAMVLTLFTSVDGEAHWLAKRYAERRLGLWDEVVMPGESPMHAAARAANEQFWRPHTNQLEWYDFCPLGSVEHENTRLEVFYLPKFLGILYQKTPLLKQDITTAAVPLRELESKLWHVTPQTLVALGILPVNGIQNSLEALSESTQPIVANFTDDGHTSLARH